MEKKNSNRLGFFQQFHLIRNSIICSRVSDKWREDQESTRYLSIIRIDSGIPKQITIQSPLSKSKLYANVLVENGYQIGVSCISDSDLLTHLSRGGTPLFRYRIGLSKSKRFLTAQSSHKQLYYLLTPNHLYIYNSRNQKLISSYSLPLTCSMKSPRMDCLNNRISWISTYSGSSVHPQKSLRTYYFLSGKSTYFSLFSTTARTA